MPSTDDVTRSGLDALRRLVAAVLEAPLEVATGTGVHGGRVAALGDRLDAVRADAVPPAAARRPRRRRPRRLVGPRRGRGRGA